MDLERSTNCDRGSLYALETGTCQKCEDMDEELLRKVAGTLDLDTNVSRPQLCVQVADAIDRRVAQAKRAAQLNLPANLLSLPADIVRRILTQVDVSTLLRACQTNEQVRAICNDPRLWKLMWDARFPKKTEIMRTSNDPDLLRKEYLSYARKEARVYDFHQHSYNNDAPLPMGRYLAQYLRRPGVNALETKKMYLIARGDLREEPDLTDDIEVAWKKDNAQGDDVGVNFQEAFNKAFQLDDGTFQVGSASWDTDYDGLLQVAFQDTFDPKRLSVDTLCNLELLQNTLFVDDSLALPQRLLSGDIIVGDNLTYWYVQHSNDGTLYVPFSQYTLPEVAWERVKEMETPADFWNIPLRREAEKDPGGDVRTYPEGGYQSVLVPALRNLDKYPDDDNAQIRHFYEPLVCNIGRSRELEVIDGMEALISPVTLAFPAHELAKKVAAIVSEVSFPFDGCISLLRAGRRVTRGRIEVAVINALETFPLCSPEVMASLVFETPDRDASEMSSESAFSLESDDEYNEATTQLTEYLRNTWYNDAWWDQGWKMHPWWAFLNAIKTASKGPNELSRQAAITISQSRRRKRSSVRRLQNIFYSRLRNVPVASMNIATEIESFASIYAQYTHSRDDETSTAFLTSGRLAIGLPNIVSFLAPNEYWLSSLASLLRKLNMDKNTTVKELYSVLMTQAQETTTRRADKALVDSLQSLRRDVLDAEVDTVQRVVNELRRLGGARQQLIALNTILGFAYPLVIYPCSLFYTSRTNNLVNDVPNFEQLFERTANNMSGYRRRLARYQESGIPLSDQVMKAIDATQREYKQTLRLLDELDNFTPLLYKIWAANAGADAISPTFTVMEKQLANAILQMDGYARPQDLVLKETFSALVDSIARVAQGFKSIQEPWMQRAVQDYDERAENLDMLKQLTGLRLAPTKDEVQRQIEIERQRDEDRRDRVFVSNTNVIEEEDLPEGTLEAMIDAYNANRARDAVEIWNRALAERDRPQPVVNPNAEQEELAAALGGAEELARARREEEQILGVAPADGEE